MSTEYVRLEGIPPERFDGDRAQTRNFLNRFKRFVLMNKDATVMKDVLKQCAYFLSLIEGPNVEGWSERAYGLLKKIQSGTTPLPPNTAAWELLEKDLPTVVYRLCRTRKGP